ncbi:hypothetical protein RA210_U20522 [Rubrivivax sp. A210]|nr:hypothetical protein RA210_U20522 [Rubrivivax sp. A210]
MRRHRCGLRGWRNEILSDHGCPDEIPSSTPYRQRAAPLEADCGT